MDEDAAISLIGKGKSSFTGIGITVFAKLPWNRHVKFGRRVAGEGGPALRAPRRRPRAPIRFRRETSAASDAKPRRHVPSPPMVARYPVFRPKSAAWSRGAAGFAVPLLVVSGLAHRFGWIGTQTLLFLLGMVGLLVLVAGVLAVVALVSLWNRGGEGGRTALKGLAIALVAATPFGYAVYQSLTRPQLYEVSTDLADPPFFRRAPGLTDPRYNPIAAKIPPEVAAEQRAAYPDIVSRRYEVPVTQLYAAAAKVVSASGWQVTTRHEPVNDRDRGRIEAVAHTLIFGFVDDVSIRVLDDPDGSRLDMRSVTRVGQHDLGANAARIRDFLAAVDAAVIELHGQ